LDEVAAFALPRMALVTLGQLGFDEILAGSGGDLRPELLTQLFIELLVAPKVARLQDRGADRDVLLAEPHAFAERARRMPDFQAEIPQHVEDELDDAFAPRGLFERAYEEQIDVRPRRQLGAAIAARGDNANALRRGW